MTANFGHLNVQLGKELLKVVPLNAPVITIGRGPENSLPLAHQLVSRHHAEIRINGPQPILIDLGSSNGTHLRGSRLLPNQPTLLTIGDVFQIGPFSLTYQVPDQRFDTEHALLVELDQPSYVLDDSMVTHAPIAPRRAYPPRYARDRPSTFLPNLPVIFQENDFFERFLLIFESIWEPLEQRQDHIQMYFNPRTCPEPILSWLATWLDLSYTLHWPEGRKRRFLAEVVDLYRWRGTRYGLERIIEVCTGYVPRITELPSTPFVIDISVTLPPDSDGDRALIEQLVLAHKPAHIGFHLTARTT
ncbi:MAG: FHA domain-containing protein [Thermomicrobia bacterium]|nr:FHA domain-containing protein [Thermomicrobia bacterium]MCA1725508.1 FHA domain-containing protein [Thermomicrobia bacterium]